MPQAEDDKPDERLRRLYPDLNEEDLAEAGYNLDRYIEVTLRIFESLCDPSRAEQLTELLEHVAASDPEKLQEIEARRAVRPQDAPVPLDDLIEETAAKRPGLPHDAHLYASSCLQDRAIRGEAGTDSNHDQGLARLRQRSRGCPAQAI